MCLPWKTADEHFPEREREREKEVGLGSWWNEPTKIFANYPPNGLPDGGLQIWLPSPNGGSASRWCFCSGLAGFLRHPVWNRKGKINNYTLLSLLNDLWHAKYFQTGDFRNNYALCQEKLAIQFTIWKGLIRNMRRKKSVRRWLLATTIYGIAWAQPAIDTI